MQRLFTAAQQDEAQPALVPSTVGFVPPAEGLPAVVPSDSQLEASPAGRDATGPGGPSRKKPGSSAAKQPAEEHAQHVQGLGEPPVIPGELLQGLGEPLVMLGEGGSPGGALGTAVNGVAGDTYSEGGPRRAMEPGVGPSGPGERRTAGGEPEEDLRFMGKLAKEGHLQKSREAGNPGGTTDEAPRGFRESEDSDEANDDEDEDEVEVIHERGPRRPPRVPGPDVAFKGLWHPKRCTEDQVRTPVSMPLCLT